VTQPKTLIVLTFDRLPATLLSCYGNEWIETQNFDRLAAQAAVFEEHYVEIPGPAGPNHPWWTGRYEFFSNASSAGDTAASLADSNVEPSNINDLIQQFQAAGLSCHFVSERADELPVLRDASFEIVEGADGLDSNHADSHFAKLIDRGIELLQEGSPKLIWLHSRGVPSPWLPTRVFAELYLDELEDADETGPEVARQLLEQLAEDETLASLLLSDHVAEEDPADDTDNIEPSERDLTSDKAVEIDESILFGPFAEAVSRYLFAGYVSQLDHILGRLLSAIESAEGTDSNQEIALVVTSASGQSFCERDEFVSAKELRRLPLSDQTLLTPLIVRTSGRVATFGHRIRGILQPLDLVTILKQVEISDELGSPDTGYSLGLAFHDHALHFGSAGAIGIRDSEWFYCAADRAELQGFDLATLGLYDTSGFLFVKPDDVHDINNVLNQEQDEAGRMVQALRDRIPN
jgi:hypothetical protein